uniref:Uncharacterized protein n=1 Tax=Timema tahoe TaxID=61484 RepID=A0A7R9NY95_9NEOP|nr:unnamed protein product [Timema tahoe]
MFRKPGRDGELLVSGTQEGDLFLWYMESHLLKQKMQGHSGSVYAASFSPDGKKLVSCGEDGSFKVVDLSTGMLLYSKTLEEELSVSYTILISPPSGVPQNLGNLVNPSGNQMSLLGWLHFVARRKSRKFVCVGPDPCTAEDKDLCAFSAMMQLSSRSCLCTHYPIVYHVSRHLPLQQPVVVTNHTGTPQSPVLTVTASDDGSLVVTGGQDRRVIVWQPAISS